MNPKHKALSNRTESQSERVARIRKMLKGEGINVKHNDNAKKMKKENKSPWE